MPRQSLRAMISSTLLAFGGNASKKYGVSIDLKHCISIGFVVSAASARLVISNGCRYYVDRLRYRLRPKPGSAATSTMVGSNEKRLFRVTAGNLRNNHLYVNGHHDFFPRDCVGGARRSAKAASGIEIALDGLNETVSTDIGSDPKTGKPKGYFRGRAWVRKFYEHHEIQAGTVLSLEKLSARKYRLSVEPNGNSVQRRLRAAEFFSGIGLVRLALESRGWQIVFANDIDADKAEMYRHNWPKDDHLVVGDIHGLKPDDIPTCDLFTASFPCNDLSICGRWEGQAARSPLHFGAW